MSQEEQCEGTGLRKVYDILVSVPPEQVLSLTFHLGESPEDNIIHALCLMILRKEEKALNQLQMLGDNSLAKLLSEIWRKSGCKLENFADQCGQSLDLSGESLAALARVFKILSEHQLCDQLLRNLAYKRALTSNSLRADSREDLLYDQLKEEAKDVCGPQLAVWMCSSGNLKSDSYNLAPNSQIEGVTTHVQSLPSTLQSSCSEPSYPSHLEISLPPKIPYEGDQVTPENPEQKPIDSLNDGNPPEQSHLSSVESTEASGLEKSKMAAASGTEHGKHQDGGFNVKPPCEKSTFGANLNQYVEEEDEVIFYSFVILHALEDGEVARSMKEKVERIVGTKGATFSEDFALPGKSTLGCIEDAINNSGFTILLLTQNFNTRMLEVKTNSALINSINNQHKYNTVIPLLPKDNRMSRNRIPIVLQTLVPLEENKSFESKLKKVLSPAKIHQQKSIWLKEQRKHQSQLPQGCEAAHKMENLNILGSSEKSLLQKRPNIRIENASYVMIGDNCHMTVDHCDPNDPIVREERK